MLELTPEQTLVNQHLERLDSVTKQMESRWGVLRLPQLVPEDLNNRWKKQWEKLNAAILSCNAAETIGLAEGCVRGWQAMEAAAVAAGFKPDIGQVMEAVMPSGGVLRVCASLLDARKPAPEGMTVLTMDQVARMVESRSLVAVIAKNEGKFTNREIPKLPKEFWDNGGDEIGI